MSSILEETSDRIRTLLAHRDGLTERKMFGGRAFMLNGNMVVGIMKDGTLMARVGKENYQAVLERPDASPLDMNGRPMTGMVEVAGDVIEDEERLIEWVTLCADFAAGLPPK